MEDLTAGAYFYFSNILQNNRMPSSRCAKIEDVSSKLNFQSWAQCTPIARIPGSVSLFSIFCFISHNFYSSYFWTSRVVPSAPRFLP